jgi:hypothetical protein
MFVEFAHIVVVPGMLPAVTMLDVFPSTSSRLWTTPTAAAGRVFIAITRPVLFSFSRGFASRDWEGSTMHG